MGEATGVTRLKCHSSSNDVNGNRMRGVFSKSPPCHVAAWKE